MSLRAVELFCGIGGFRLAADRLGLKTVFANDISGDASTVYRDRFGPTGYVEAPIEAALDAVPAHDLMTAGFPCQPFSSAGKKQGADDPRARTLDRLIEVLERHTPRAVVLENVPFILSVRRGQPFVELLGSLARLGYGVTWRVVNAADFGVPQYRPRIIIVATREVAPPMLWDPGDGRCPVAAPLDVVRANRLPAWGTQSHGPLMNISARPIWRDWSKLRVGDALAPDVEPVYDFTDATLRRLHESAPVNRVIRGVEVLYNQAGGSRMGYTVYGIGGLAPTLTATTSRHYERFAVRGRYRRLTPEEYAVIQGFPADHCSAAPHAKRYVLCGNAIPPPMAEWALFQALSALQASTSRTGKKPSLARQDERVGQP